MDSQSQQSKKCSACKRTLPLSMFGQYRVPHGDPNCKQCRSSQGRSIQRKKLNIDPRRQFSTLLCEPVLRVHNQTILSIGMVAYPYKGIAYSIDSKSIQGFCIGVKNGMFVLELEDGTSLSVVFNKNDVMDTIHHYLSSQSIRLEKSLADLQLSRSVLIDL